MTNEIHTLAIKSIVTIVLSAMLFYVTVELSRIELASQLIPTCECTRAP